MPYRISVNQGDPVIPAMRDAVAQAKVVGQEVQVICQKGQGFIMFTVEPEDDYKDVVLRFHLDCLRAGWDPHFFLKPLYEARPKSPALIPLRCA